MSNPDWEKIKNYNPDPENIIFVFRDDFMFLSNFDLVDVEHEGIIYPSVEHAYQASKTLDIEKRKLVASNNSPFFAKNFGKNLDDLREDWDSVKLSIMLSLLRKKFVKGSIYAEMLLATEPMKLVEGNWWHDVWWGYCICKKCEGKSQNYLGKLLMKVRKELKEQNG